MAERRSVAADVVGSKPTSRPNHPFNSTESQNRGRPHGHSRFCAFVNRIYPKTYPKKTRALARNRALKENRCRELRNTPPLPPHRSRLHHAICLLEPPVGLIPPGSPDSTPPRFPPARSCMSTGRASRRSKSTSRSARFLQSRNYRVGSVPRRPAFGSASKLRSESPTSSASEAVTMPSRNSSLR